MRDQDLSIDIDTANLVEDALKNVFLRVEGKFPTREEGSFRLNAENVKRLEEKFDNSAKIKEYCTNVLLIHLWSKKKGSHAPFFLNQRVFSDNVVEYLAKYSNKLQKKYGSILRGTDLFQGRVYADIFDSELDYLRIASKCFIHDEEMDWSLLMPSVSWTIVCSGDLSEIPEGRFAKMAVPKVWWNFPILEDGNRVLFKEVYRRERVRLKPVDIRRVFMSSARQAFWDAGRQWAESVGILKTYVAQGFKEPLVMERASAINPSMLDLTSPLRERDTALFETAKQWLKERDLIHELPKLESVLERDLPEGIAQVREAQDESPKGISVKKGRLNLDRLGALKKSGVRLDA